MKDLVKNVSIPWLGYMFFFVGIGFLSGAIVHYPLNPSWFLFVGIVGALLFVVGAIINEVFVLKKNIIKEGVFGFVFFSLLLGIGVGMVSGGIQHFEDIAQKAIYLVPAGITLSIFSFVFKNKINLTLAHGTMLIAKSLLIALPTYIILLNLATPYATIPRKEANSHHAPASITREDAHSETEQLHQGEMQHITTEKDFLLLMIPHHLEAIESATQVLEGTQNPQMARIAAQIISAQTPEVASMKGWLQDLHKTNFDPANSSYQSMMGVYDASNSAKSDKEFLQQMVAHHKMAIQMAQDVQKVGGNKQVLELAQNIITSQNSEVQEFEGILQVQK